MSRVKIRICSIHGSRKECVYRKRRRIHYDTLSCTGYVSSINNLVTHANRLLYELGHITPASKRNGCHITLRNMIIVVPNYTDGTVRIRIKHKNNDAFKSDFTTANHLIHQKQFKSVSFIPDAACPFSQFVISAQRSNSFSLRQSWFCSAAICFN